MRFYRLDTSASGVAAALDAAQNGDVWEGGGILPGHYAPVIVRGAGGRRQLMPRQWGVPPPPRGSHTVTTVRNLASPFWIGTLRHTEFRCLVPMTAFAAGAGASGDWITVPSSPVFAAAGIWRDSEVASFAVLTTGRDGSPNGTAMPAILHPRHYAQWLNDDWKQAQGLIAPFPAEMLGTFRPARG